MPKPTSIYTTLAGVAGLVLSVVSGQAQSASATISDVTAPGGFDYTITLTDTGTFNLNGFWYAWTVAGNNLAVNPSSAGNSLGWVNSLDANSIQWFNTSGTALTPGHSGLFTFFSPTAPAAITTPPSGESVAYVSFIDASQGTAGDSTGIFSPVLVASPEPSSLALLAIGSVGFLGAGLRKFRAQK